MLIRSLRYSRGTSTQRDTLIQPYKYDITIYIYICLFIFNTGYQYISKPPRYNLKYLLVYQELYQHIKYIYIQLLLY